MGGSDLARVCLLALAVVGHAHAQWTQEPEKVVGIRLGAPLAASDMAECSGTPSNAPCLDRRADGWSRVLRTGLRATIDVFELEGVVGNVTMTMPHGQFEEMRQTLIERYGAPHRDIPGQVQNRVGAIFSNRLLLWKGPNVSIALHERHKDVDTSAALFTHNASTARLLNQDRERAKANASKL